MRDEYNFDDVINFFYAGLFCGLIAGVLIGLIVGNWI